MASTSYALPCGSRLNKGQLRHDRLGQATFDDGDSPMPAKRPSILQLPRMTSHEWIPTAIEMLVQQPVCGYALGGVASTEPTALAALALLAHGRPEAAGIGLQWLADLQSEDGSLGIGVAEESPCWPTALAVIAWRSAGRGGSSTFERHVKRAIGWMLRTHGETQARKPEMGHDSTLLGWPWVQGTHSWMEPTAFNVLALKAAGRNDHPRTREAVRLLTDRLLPGGGCNYGNTLVLGQLLRPHVQPTGLTLLALGGERNPSARVKASLEWLRRALSGQTSASSLAFGLLGLAAHGELPTEARDWLAEAWQRLHQRKASPYKAALLALAALGKDSPLCPHAAFDTASRS